MLEIWTFMVVKETITHFVTQFTHVSRHFGVYSRKQKKIRETCFENVVSDLKKSILLFQKKCKKVQKF